MNMRERDTHIIILDDGQHEIFTIVLASEDLGYYVLSTDKKNFATERHKELHLSEHGIHPAPSFRIRAPWTRLVPACIPRQVTLNYNLPLPGKLVHTK